jgi:DNA-directed RNA polymerase specialized sigma24 family protein
MEDTLKELLKMNRALLLVQLGAASKPEEAEKPEVLLARAGFTATEAAQLLGKPLAGVRKAIQRGGKAA